MADKTSPFGTDFPRLWDTQEFAAMQPAAPEGFDEFAKHFEEATGWVVEFAESKKSLKNRIATGSDIPTGSISISDMSAKLAKGQRTASREKCDKVIASFNSLLGELQELRSASQSSFKSQKPTQRTASKAEAEIIQPPFEGWHCDLRQSDAAISRWMVTSDERIIAVSFACDSLQRNDLAKVIEAVLMSPALEACRADEVVESIGVLSCDEFDVEELQICCAIIDPLGAEIEVCNSGLNAALCGGFKSVQPIEDEFRGFLQQGQCLFIGGSEFEWDLLQTLTPDFESVMSLLEAGDGDTPTESTCRFVIGRD